MPNVDIINLDYETLIAEARRLKNSRPALAEWDFDNANDPLRHNLDSFLLAIEKLGLFANNIVQEFSMATALTRESLEDKAFFGGYNVTQRTAAIGNIKIVTIAGTAVTIAPYSLVLIGKSINGSTIYAENTQTIVLNSVDTIKDNVQFITGKTESSEYTAKGLNSEVIYIQDTIIENSISLKVNNEDWAEVIRFDGSVLPTDKKYIIRKLGDDNYAIICGNGTNGKIFPAGSSVTIKYRKGNGLEENGLGSRFQLYVTPTNRVMSVSEASISPNFSGAENEEDAEHIRKYAPQIPKIGNSVGNPPDADLYIGSLSGVGRVKTVNLGPNSMRSYVLDNIGAPASPSFLSSIKIDLDKILVFNSFIDLQPATVKTVNITLEIIYKSNSNIIEIENQVRAKINTLLNPFTRDQYDEFLLEFGSDLLISDVISLVDGIPGVIACAVQSPVPVSAQVLVSVKDSEILTNEGSNILISWVKYEESSISRGRNDKFLYTNPKFNQ